MPTEKDPILSIGESAAYLGVTRSGLWCMHSKYFTIDKPSKLPGGKKGYRLSYLAAHKARASRPADPAPSEIDKKYVQALFVYNPDTGIFTWRERPRSMFPNDHSWKTWNTRFKGQQAGVIHEPSEGYKRIEIGIHGAKYRAHRLAFLYMEGWIPEEIDHKNRDATDNRWSNLRDGTGINNKNLSLKKSNTSGVCGVYWSKKSKRWQAYARIDGKARYLGQYDDIKKADEVVKTLRGQHGYSTGHGQKKDA